MWLHPSPALLSVEGSTAPAPEFRSDHITTMSGHQPQPAQSTAKFPSEPKLFPTFFVNQNDKIPLDGFLVTKIPISVKFSTFIFCKNDIVWAGFSGRPLPS